MSTELLFQGLRSDGGGWVYGIPLTNKIGTFIITESNPHYCEQYGYIEINEFAQVIPSSVGQFTGRCTPSEERIFGGHQVRVHYPLVWAGMDGFVGKVVMIDGQWMVQDGRVSIPLFGDHFFLEIIGTIVIDQEGV